MSPSKVILLSLLLSGCCAPFPGNRRGEFEPPVLILDSYKVQKASSYYRFAAPVTPPRAKNFEEIDLEPSFAVDALPTDKWLPAFKVNSMTFVASEEYKERQCRWLHENFGKSHKTFYDGWFFDFYKGCMRDRSYMLVLNAENEVLGWSRLGSVADCNKARNPMPRDSEVWPKGQVLIEAGGPMPGDAIPQGAVKPER